VGGVEPAQAYRVSLFCGAVISGLGIPLLLLVRAQEPAPVRLSRTQRPAVARLGLRLSAFRSVIGNPRLAWLVAQFVIADAFIRIGGNLVVPFFNVYFLRRFGVDERWFGALGFAERV